jgi:hypothetical protein
LVGVLAVASREGKAVLVALFGSLAAALDVLQRTD